MTKLRDPEALLSAYLGVGMDVLSDRVVDTVLDEVHRTRQRGVFGPWRTRLMSRTTLAAAAVIAVVALSGAFFVIQRGQPAGVGGPGPTAGSSASPSQAAVASPSATPSATPSPTPTATPSPTPTPFVVPDGRNWTVTVRNKSSDPTTLFVTEQTESGMGQQCGTVTPSVVPPDTTRKVAFLLPPKSVKSCWIWVNPVPGEGGSLFQTSDAPMKGEILIMANGQGGWLSP
jgi:hypothetical protein